MPEHLQGGTGRGREGSGEAEARKRRDKGFFAGLVWLGLDLVFFFLRGEGCYFESYRDVDVVW